MSLTYLDPTSGPEDSETEIAERPESLEGMTIGLLDNGKTHAREILECVADELQSRYENLHVEFFDKPSPFKPAPEGTVQDHAVKFGAVITGVGD